jgi:DNA-binding response OmpR family regulator
MHARILIVDDDQGYVAGVTEWLEANGYDVIAANTFEDAKRAVVSRAPHLVILDVRLGAFNGLQLISTGDVKIPVIVVTGFDDPVLRSDAAAFGANYLVKPVVPTELLTMIQQLLSSVSAAG